MAGGMEHTAAGIGHVGHNINHLQRVHPLDGRLTVTLQTEGDNTAGAVGQVFLTEGIVGIVLQAAVVHPRHLRAVVQELSYTLGILAMLRHTQVQRLQAEVEQERVLRSGDGAEVAHQLCNEFRGIAHLAESLHVGQAMIALIGRAEAREFLGMCQPIKITAVNDASAYLGSHAVHVFRGAVRHDVGTPLEGTAVDGCGKGIVDDEGHTVLVGNLGKALNVEDGTARIRNRLAKHGLRIGTEGSLYLLVAGFLRDERAVDAQLLQRHAKEVVGATIDFVGGDEMVACLTDIEDRIEVGSLSAGGQHSPYSTLERGNLRSHSVVGRILQTGIEIALLLQVEELRHLVGVVVFEGG